MLVVDNEMMMSGVDRNASIVIDVDDKMTTLEEEDTVENKIEVILRGMNSLIGETSNCATAYHNKRPKTDEQKKIYEGFVDLLSVVNGKNIDNVRYSRTVSPMTGMPWCAVGEPVNAGCRRERRLTGEF